MTFPGQCQALDNRKPLWGLVLVRDPLSRDIYWNFQKEPSMIRTLSSDPLWANTYSAFPTRCQGTGKLHPHQCPWCQAHLQPFKVTWEVLRCIRRRQIPLKSGTQGCLFLKICILYSSAGANRVLVYRMGYSIFLYNVSGSGNFPTELLLRICRLNAWLWLTAGWTAVLVTTSWYLHWASGNLWESRAPCSTLRKPLEQKNTHKRKPLMEKTEGLVLRMLMENNKATSTNKVKPQRIGTWTTLCISQPSQLKPVGQLTELPFSLQWTGHRHACPSRRAWLIANESLTGSGIRNELLINLSVLQFLHLLKWTFSSSYGYCKD